MRHLLTSVLLATVMTGAAHAASSDNSIINEAKGYPYTSSGTHVSARAWKKPGWVVMSSIGYGSYDLFTNKRKAPA